jgi:hypothetical protein
VLLDGVLVDGAEDGRRLRVDQGDGVHDEATDVRSRASRNVFACANCREPSSNEKIRHCDSVIADW